MAMQTRSSASCDRGLEGEIAVHCREIKGLLDLVSRFKEGNCTMKPDEVDEICAICFAVCWSCISTEELAGISTQTAHQWLEDAVAKVGTRVKDQGLAEGPRLRQDLFRSEATIRRHWKVQLYDILPDRSCTRPISVRFAEEACRPRSFDRAG